jgi:EAL domain-containing protein (putative c-di-GMP-specific phosphodiesterase class I)/GGDEF domain-containing protein
MELAVPHVVVWTRGPGVGTDLVAALAEHPVEVSEVRGLAEARRAAAGPTPLLVVLVCPHDSRGRVAEAGTLFPGVPILLFSEQPGNGVAGDALVGTAIAVLPAGRPLQELCWHVAEALSRSTRSPETPERRLGPMFIEIDGAGVVGAACDLRGIWFFPGPAPQPGKSLLPILQPDDRCLFVQNLERAVRGTPSFFPVRILDHRGDSHPMYAGLRAAGDRVALILQPLIDAAPVVGRRRGTRDPLTGLLDRWELWRRMEKEEIADAPAFVLHARLDAFESLASAVDFSQVDGVFDRVASAIAQVFPWPAQPSRLTGGAFLLLVKNATGAQVRARAARLIRMVNEIGTTGWSGAGMSIGIAAVTNGNYDLAVRLAETAAREAHAAGGRRAIVAGSDTLIRARLRDLSASMDLESWEVWLQPVGGAADRPPEFHEALARFGTGEAPRKSRPEFFLSGHAEGLLERFDRLMALRSIELLTSYPELRLSVNVTPETFQLESFPESFLGLLRDARIGAERIIVEISPACLALPAGMAMGRLDRLAAAGVAIALDDFGSGLCSLRHLTDYPLSFVKLDELVTGYVADDPLQRNFVRMVVNVCRARGIRTVAEYTRTREQLERLAADGVDLFQGELLGMPRPAAEILASLAMEPARP